MAVYHNDDSVKGGTLRCLQYGVFGLHFYIPSFNLAIEYDGEQHFVKKYCWGKDNLKIQRRDKIKTQFCLDEGIKLLRINCIKNIENA